MIVRNEACPECVANGHDSTGNHLMIFEDGGRLCKRAEYHSSGKNYYVSPDGEFKEEDMNIEDLKSGPMRARGIGPLAANHFDIKIEYDHDRNEVRYYYPEREGGRIIGYGVRELPKTFYNVGEKMKGRSIDLGGQCKCTPGGKRLLICEGRDDAIAAWQMLKDKYPKFTPNVVWNSGTSTKRVADNLDFVNSFEEVIICFDPDEAGDKGASQVCKLIGPKAKVAKTSMDVNDLLQKGRSAEFVSSFFEAKPYVPDGILTVNDVYEDAIAMPRWGRKWPWPTLDNLTYGRRDGDGIYVGAGVKAGKTEWLSQMVHYILETEGLPVFMFKFEQSGDQTVKAIAGKKARKNFSRPDGDFTQEELIHEVTGLKDKVFMFDASYSDVGITNMWDRMKPAIRYATMVLGIKDIFIDPITQLTDGLSPTDTETELRRFSNELAGMAKDLGFFYYCFCHLKEPPLQSKSHEEGGRVKVAQFRGSRAMAEKTKLMLGIERNQQADDVEDRNISTFRLLLNSGFGRTGSFPVMYNEDTTDYLELTDDYMQ